MGVTEAIEICPWCMGETERWNWDAGKSGYVVNCDVCGRQIFLCDECRHAPDNPGGKCDWYEETRDGKIYGMCWRGTTVNDIPEGGEK